MRLSRFIACVVVVAIVASTTACGSVRAPKPGPVGVIDTMLMVKDIIDLFDQPVYHDVPLLCEVLNDVDESKEVVGILHASTRRISDKTERSPFSIPFVIDDALEDARHAECHWSPLATPQKMKVSVEVTAYQQTPATKYARAAFQKLITDSQESLSYQRVSLGHAACVAGSGKSYYGVLRKDNVLMAVSVQAREPVSTSPVETVLSVLDGRFGPERGSGAPERPDEHDDCA